MTSKIIMRYGRAQLVATAIVLAVLGVPAIGAKHAGANYTVVECSYSAGVGIADVVHSTGGTPKIFASDECTGGFRAGWGLGLEANGQTPKSHWSAWSWAAAPATTFASVQATVHQNANYGYGGLYSCAGGSQGFGSEWATPSCNNTSFFQISLHCFSSPCQSPGGAGDKNLAGGWVFTTHLVANVADLAAPSVGASGQLLNGGVISGVQQLQVSAGDAGGGVRTIDVSVNGAVSRSSGPFCSPHAATGGYTRLVPCPPGVNTTINLDTEKDAGWANGPNDVEICATDVGGNTSASCIQRVVTVDNSCPSSGGPAAASTLDSGIESAGGQLRSSAFVSSRAAPIVRGALRNAAGQPITGATICVYETVELPDSSRQLAQIATTNTNGRFATRLNPGPSRDITVVYRYNKDHLGDELEVDSKVVPTLKVRNKNLVNGQAAKFRGRVPGPNADSRAVTLQAKVGKKWRTFKVIKTNSLGAYRAKYPFRSTRGKVRYVFRARVKRQGGYPYEPGSSSSRKVLVRG